MIKADKEQKELEKKAYEEEKELTATRLKKLNKDVEENGKALKEALDKMPSAGKKSWTDLWFKKSKKESQTISCP